MPELLGLGLVGACLQVLDARFSRIPDKTCAAGDASGQRHCCSLPHRIPSARAWSATASCLAQNQAPALPHPTLACLECLPTGVQHAWPAQSWLERGWWKQKQCRPLRRASCCHLGAMVPADALSATSQQQPSLAHTSKSHAHALHSCPPPKGAGRSQQGISAVPQGINAVPQGISAVLQGNSTKAHACQRRPSGAALAPMSWVIRLPRGWTCTARRRLAAPCACTLQAS